MFGVRVKNLHSILRNIPRTNMSPVFLLFTLFPNTHTVTYHLSRSALIFAQAAGTGASAGAAAVSESDMSVVVLLRGVEGSCPVRFLSSERLWILAPPTETDRERKQRCERVGERGGEHSRRWEEIKHVRGTHMCVHSSQGLKEGVEEVKGQ